MEGYISSKIKDNFGISSLENVFRLAANKRRIATLIANVWNGVLQDIEEKICCMIKHTVCITELSVGQ